MANIIELKDSSNTKSYPLTVGKAVFMEDGSNLEDGFSDVKSAFDTALIPNENLYNPAKQTNGYYIATNGDLTADSRLAVTEPIPLKPKQTIRTIGLVNGTWQSLYSVRCNAVYSAADTSSSNKLSRNDSLSTCYTYTNTSTTNTVYIRFAVFVSHETYTVSKLMIYLFDGTTPSQSDYVPYSYVVKDVAINNIQDGTVTPEAASFLNQTKNYYDPVKVINGYYMSIYGEILQDSRFSYIKLTVPNGKTIFSSAITTSGGTTRTLINSVRQYTVKNKNDEVVTYDNSIGAGSTSYKYTNNTGDDVFIYYTLFYNHSDYIATDVMIQIVNSASDVVISDYVPYGYTFSDEIFMYNASGAEIEKIVTVPKSYFAEEIQTTAESIRTKTNAPCLTYNIITDTHVRLGNSDSVRQTYDSIANITALNRISYADAVVHLGDLVNQTMYTVDGATDDVIYKTMRDYLKKFNDINPHAYMINGNHDGHVANVYQEKEWYSICGRLNESYVTREGGTGYFYVDYPKLKTRCVFLATPDNIEDASSAVFGYTPRMLSWLVTKALDVQNDYGVIMFAHIPPFYTWYITNGMTNRADFYGICTAFHNHTSYTGTVQSANFSSKSGTKLVAYICGHSHGDAVLTAGQTVVGKDVNGNDETTTNSLPCPVINIGCGVLSSSAMSNYNAVAPSRTDKTVTQDLWDTMIYRPDLNKIYMIRFGAGSDREISVN